MPKIELDLRKYCIETAIKRFYNLLLSESLRNRSSDAKCEEKLALLQNALTGFDFSSLRSVHKELAGNSNANIVLTESDGGLPGIAIDGRIIDVDRFARD